MPAAKPITATITFSVGPGTKYKETESVVNRPFSKYQIKYGLVNPSYSVPGVGGLVGRSGVGAEITTKI